MTRVTSLPLRHRTNVNKEHLWLTFERSCLIGVSIGRVAPKCKFDFSRSIAEDTANCRHRSLSEFIPQSTELVLQGNDECT